MKKTILFTLIIISIFLIGCAEKELSKPTNEDSDKITGMAVVCNKPYIQVGTDCCLDKDDNSICDSDEKEEEPVEIKQTEKEEVKEEPKPKEIKTAKLQEKVIVDNIAYSVEKVRRLTQIGDYIGDSFWGVKADGRFYAVFLNIENIGKESQNIYSNRFRIVDNKGRKYDPDTEAETYYKQAISFGEQIQPNLPITGAKIFDLPEEATGLKLEIRGDWLSVSEVMIDIDEAWVTN